MVLILNEAILKKAEILNIYIIFVDYSFLNDSFIKQKGMFICYQIENKVKQYKN